MAAKKKSWKTTVAGILAILLAIGTAAHASLSGGAAIEWSVVIGEVIAGIGLLLARDNDKTSEDVGAK